MNIPVNPDEILIYNRTYPRDHHRAWRLPDGSVRLQTKHKMAQKWLEALLSPDELQLLLWVGHGTPHPLPRFVWSELKVIAEQCTPPLRLAPSQIVVMDSPRFIGISVGESSYVLELREEDSHTPVRIERSTPGEVWTAAAAILYPVGEREPFLKRYAA